MSMNIHISAERTVTVNKTGKQSTQQVSFDCYQTPTNVTYEILATPAPIEAYKAWALSISKDDEEEVFAADDYMCDTPIGKKTVNYGKQHITELEAFVAECEAEGYEIEVYDL